MRGCSVDEGKRVMIGKMFAERKLDVLALSETKMKGKGEREFGSVNGRVSGVVRGRAREGVALLLSTDVLNSVVEWKEVSSRLMWAKVKFGKEMWVFVSAYGPGSERGEAERDNFWNMVDDTLQSFEERVNVVLLGDLNARVGNEVIDGVVGRHGVPGRNESGDRMLGLCMEQELVIGNTFFKKKDVYKYTWVRNVNGLVVEKAMMDYVVISRNARNRLLDVRVQRGAATDLSDHFLVEGDLKVGKGWLRVRRTVEVKRALRVSELEKEEKVEEYQQKIETKWNEVRDQEAVSVDEEWQRFKTVVVGCAEEVCGTRRIGGGIRKGSEWWCEEVKVVIEEKKKAYGNWLQKKDHDSYQKYKEKNNQAKRAVERAKRRADDRWGSKLTEDFCGNKKMFWKEVKRTRREKSGKEETVKAVDGTVLTEKKAIQERWAEYFEGLLNVGG